MINYMMLEGRLINDPQPIKLEKNLKLQFQLEFNYFGNKTGVINCSVWNRKGKRINIFRERDEDRCCRKSRPLRMGQ